MSINGVTEFCQLLYDSIQQDSSLDLYNSLNQYCNKSVSDQMKKLISISQRISSSSDFESLKSKSEFLKNGITICKTVLEEIDETVEISNWLRKIEIELLNNVVQVNIEIQLQFIKCKDMGNQLLKVFRQEKNIV
jgi:hypothetical protein